MDITTIFIISAIILAVLILTCVVASKIGRRGVLKDAALLSVQKEEDGFIGVPTDARSLVGKKGLVLSDLRPAGKVRIEGKVYDAMSDREYINKGENIVVSKAEMGQVYVMKDEQN